MKRACPDCGARATDVDGDAVLYDCASSWDGHRRRQSLACATRAVGQAGTLLLETLAVELNRTVRGIARAIRHGNRP